jgi:hypothetical protein
MTGPDALQSDIRRQVSDNSPPASATVTPTMRPGTDMLNKSWVGVAGGTAANGLLPGIILLAASLLEILAMAHHPTVATPDISKALQSIAELSKAAGIVHGVLLALMLLVVYGLSEFALRRGLTRPLIRAGAIAYGAGVIAMQGAALVSGFVVPDLASLMPHSNPVDLQIDAQLLTLCRVLNHSSANFGAVAMCTGIGLWSWDLLFGPAPRRWAGALGLAVGSLPALALIAGVIHLDVHGMSAVVLAQALWYVAIAVLLMRDSTAPSPRTSS